MPVGQLISARAALPLPVAEIETRLAGVDFDLLASATQDRRMPVASWTHCLRYELAMLVSWLAHRALAYHSASAERSGPVPRSVLTLLPRYGFALHALRRSLPFAVLGIPTAISVPQESRESARTEIWPLVSTLGLENVVTIGDATPAEEVRVAVANGVPIFVTGRLTTWRTLTQRYPTAAIVGATGECAAILSGDPTAAAELEDRLAERKLSISCTNHQLTIIAEASVDRAAVTATYGTLSTAFPGTVADELRRVHPSLVLIPQGQPRPVDEFVAGYRTVECDEFGVAGSTVGFGRDPVAGWPGDHCI